MIGIPSINSYKSVICLNSCVHCDIIRDLRSTLPIIATDGAANLLMLDNILPTYVIGDMDSISREISDKCNCIHITDQNSTDFDKAINFARQNDLLPCIVTGVDGGFLDHSLNNFSTFVRLPSALYLSSDNFGFCISNDIQTLVLPIGTKISIFGAPSARVTTKGLKWELTDCSLEFFSNNSCSNRTKSENIEISVRNGTAFILIYTHEIIDAGS